MLRLSLLLPALITADQSTTGQPAPNPISVTSDENPIRSLIDPNNPLFKTPRFKLVDLLAEQRKELLQKNPDFFNNDQVPIVFMHGMGDSGSNSGMQSLCKELQDKYKAYTVCLDVDDALSSITTRMDGQLKDFVKVVQGDPKLAKGFHLMGNSQGGLLTRAYIERYNSPPVIRLLSFDGVQNGITTCPMVYFWICPFWEHIMNPYESPLVFSDYWKDHKQKETYLKESKFLADINNEKPEKNAEYKKNLISLDMYLMVEATKDTMIYPHESESHGYYRWTAEDPDGKLETMRETEVGQDGAGADDPEGKLEAMRETQVGQDGAGADDPDGKLETMRETQAYREDWIGLQTLDKAGKIKQWTYPGEHMQFPTNGLLEKEVFPLLNTTYSQHGEWMKGREEQGVVYV